MVKILEHSPMFVYYDSIYAGMVPCKIVEHGIDNNGFRFFVLEITAKRFGYRRGERIETTPIFVVPRSHVSFRKHGAVVLPFKWEFEAQQVCNHVYGGIHTDGNRRCLLCGSVQK